MFSLFLFYRLFLGLCFTIVVYAVQQVDQIRPHAIMLYEHIVCLFPYGCLHTCFVQSMQPECHTKEVVYSAEKESIVDYAGKKIEAV